MNDFREALIRDLVADLRPVRRPGRTAHLLAMWLPILLLCNVAAIAVTGPFRDGALRSLYTFPAFAAETVIAAMAVALVVHATLVSAIPRPRSPLRSLPWPALIFGAWLGFYIVGFWSPAHPVSALGYRDHCLLETQLFGLLNLGVMLWIARRLVPLWPRVTGALAGVAAAAIPAAIMQFACMYVPEHILIYHIGPIAVTAIVGALIGPAALVRRPVVPKRPGRAIP